MTEPLIDNQNETQPEVVANVPKPPSKALEVFCVILSLPSIAVLAIFSAMPKSGMDNGAGMAMALLGVPLLFLTIIPSFFLGFVGLRSIGQLTPLAGEIRRYFCYGLFGLNILAALSIISIL